MKITKETLFRAGRTFLQSALAYLAVNVVVIDFSDGKEAVRSAVIGLSVSAVAAGLSAVMNLERKVTDSNEQN